MTVGSFMSALSIQVIFFLQIKSKYTYVYFQDGGFIISRWKRAHVMMRCWYAIQSKINIKN